MILGFKQYFPWHTEETPAPTYFDTKIKISVKREPSVMYISTGRGMEAIPYGGEPGSVTYNTWESSPEGFVRGKDLVLHPKFHSIREGDRWKAGDLIHMAYGVRSKNYQQFNKGIPELERVKSVQRIEIIRDPHFGCIIQVDNRQLGMVEVVNLITNDGFDSPDDFLKWFSKDFSGQIIHWTDLRY